MSFEYNGFVYRDLEPQVRYDAEQVQLLKQADVTINESLQTINTEIDGKLTKPANPTAESAVTMLADGTVGTKPLSEFGGKLYKHTVKLWHNHDNTYTDWLEYVEYRSNNTPITDRSIISGEYCYIHFTNANTGEEIMGIVNASIAYDNMIGLTGVAGSNQSSSAVNIYGLYEFENISDYVTEL